jgi:hypothetical protein
VTVDRRQAAHRVDAGHLELGGGLEVLLAAAFERVAPGGVLEIKTPSRALHTADWRGVASPPEPDVWAGFAPLGAVAETGAPAHHWALSRRDAIWADDVGELVDQASAQQWDASREIPWEAAQGLDDTTERAVAQVMTFLAQKSSPSDRSRVDTTGMRWRPPSCPSAPCSTLHRLLAGAQRAR